MINLYTSYFYINEKLKRDEILYCITNNTKNNKIDKMYILNETDYVFNDKKIVNIKITQKPTYDLFFSTININTPTDINIIANSDILFDETIELVNDMNENECYALTRYEDGKHIGYSFSQDVWIFKNKIKKINGNYHLGIGTCDQKIAWEISQSGYNISNPSLDIKTHHIHKSSRTWDRMFTYPKPLLYLSATHIKKYIDYTNKSNNSKILLISLPSENGTNEPLFPLGIGYLLASLKLDRISEAIHYLKLDHACSQIPFIMETYQPEIIALTCTTFNRGNVKDLCHWIKTNYPDIKIILGGVHPSFLPEQTLRNYKCDFIVIGEGEQTIRELCNHIDGKINLENIDGIAYLKDDEFIQNKRRIPIQNLDDLPIPDYSFAKDLMINSKLGFVISSRGCPVRCEFCATGSYWGQKVRLNSPKRIVDEIEIMISKYQVKKIFFHDDTFNINQKRVIDICNEIISRNINIDWAVSCRVHPVSEEMIDIMVEAGCKHICWGVETGSEKMLNKISKKITKAQITNAFKLCEKHIGKITVGAFMMVGNRGEDDITISETVSFMNTLKLTDCPSTAILYILPGTKIYNDLLISHPELEKFWIENNKVNHYLYEKNLDQLINWGKMITGSGQKLPININNHFWNNILFGNVPIPVAPNYTDIYTKEDMIVDTEN